MKKIRTIVYDSLEPRQFTIKPDLTDPSDIAVVDMNDRIKFEYIGFDETAHG